MADNDQTRAPEPGGPPPTERERVLALLFGAVKEILERTLVETANAKGADGSAWLGRYESELIFMAKQTYTDGMSIENEAKDIGFLIEVLKLIFATARGNFRKGAEDH